MHVYKAAGPNYNYIVTLLILLDDSETKTNLDRDNVFDKEYAKFRTNKAFVVFIYNKHTLEKVNFISSNRKGKRINYVMGEYVYEDKYDDNKNIVCGEGIHFFLNKERAISYGTVSCKDGVYPSWNENGRQISSAEFKESKLNGNYYRWNDDGKLIKHCYYKNNIREGESRRISYDTLIVEYIIHDKKVARATFVGTTDIYHDLNLSKSESDLESDAESI